MPSNCLIVVDMQNDFLDQWEIDSRAELISKTNQLIVTARVKCTISTQSSISWL